MKIAGRSIPIRGIAMLRSYRPEWLWGDVSAGLAIAAVALPSGIAYARLAGFPPAVGIYSCILPAVAYAFFGSSRQLIVNPDAPTCALIAATVAPLAAGDPSRYMDLSVALTFFTGIFCIAGGLAGLGVISDFLSRPILTGYLHGIAISIIVGQLGGLLGLRVQSEGVLQAIAEIARRIGETHSLTLAVAVVLIVSIFLVQRLVPRAPTALLAVILGIGAVLILGLDARGLAVVGKVPKGFPVPSIPFIRGSDVWPLALGAGGILVVSFCSMMTTSRAFAIKNHYAIDANQDLVALGISDLASAFGHGFAVSGSDSRTAVGDATGGTTQMMAIIAAIVMAVVLLFFTEPLAYLPTVALAVIIIFATAGLFDLRSLAGYYRVSKGEFFHSIAATVGVITVGALPGVLIAVALSVLRLLRLASRPEDAVLGLKEEAGKLSICSPADGGSFTLGLVIYRFGASLLFFNADFFKKRATTASQVNRGSIRWFVLDAGSMPFLDITGAHTLESLRNELHSTGITLVVANARGRFRETLRRTGLAERIGAQRTYPSVHDAVAAFSTLERTSQGSTMIGA